MNELFGEDVATRELLWMEELEIDWVGQFPSEFKNTGYMLYLKTYR